MGAPWVPSFPPNGVGRKSYIPQSPNSRMASSSHTGDDPIPKEAQLTGPEGGGFSISLAPTPTPPSVMPHEGQRRELQV